MTTLSILELLQKINKKFNITVVMITHNMDVVRQICNKVAVIDKSRIVEKGYTEDVVNAPKNIVTTNLLGETLKREAC
jgi:D-methionine transport system ATP-binding protein